MGYLEESEAKLQAARKRVREGNEVRALKQSAPTLFTIMDSEISLELNRAFNEKPLSYDEYLESHGAVRGIRRIRDLLNAKEIQAPSAAQEAQSIEENMKLVKDGQK